MALDRQSIEKKDFPVGRRGYEPDAVDAHLKAMADEIEELRRSGRRRTETLASAASEQVRAIVEAAETSATEIQRQAESEADEIRQEAAGEADRTRSQATGQAREYVGKVSEATTVMTQRLDAMESELGALVESLRTGANRLSADMALLEGNMNELGAATGARQPSFEPEGPDPAAAGAGHWPTPAAVGAGAERAPAEAPAPAQPALAEAPAAADDAEGARLVALNMALNGTSRDETDRYLAENFELPDRARLLDEVYASVD